MREEIAIVHGVLAASLVVLRLNIHFGTLGDGVGTFPSAACTRPCSASKTVARKIENEI